MSMYVYIDARSRRICSSYARTGPHMVWFRKTQSFLLLSRE